MVRLSHVRGKCYVMFVKDYVKSVPEGFDQDNVFVCESRYIRKMRVFKKYKVSTIYCVCVHMYMTRCVHMYMTRCVHTYMTRCVHVHDKVCAHVHDKVCAHVHDTVCAHVHDKVCAHDTCVRTYFSHMRQAV